MYLPTLFFSSLALVSQVLTTPITENESRSTVTQTITWDERSRGWCGFHVRVQTYDRAKAWMTVYDAKGIMIGAKSREFHPSDSNGIIALEGPLRIDWQFKEPLVNDGSSIVSSLCSYL